MKRCIAAFAFLLSCAAAAYPQDAGQALEYGVRVNIDPEYETSLDLSYREDPNTHMMDLRSPTLVYPVWTPAGDRIYYSDHSNIYSIPAAGGTPRLEFEGILLYPYNGRRYVLPQMILSLTGISPDGKKLYFIQNMVGEGSGATVVITEELDKDGKLKGWGYNFDEGDYALRRLDLETGIVATVAHGVSESRLSQSGKYLEYLTWPTKITRVLDLETGEDWSLEITARSAVFTDNDRNLLYLALTDGKGKFFKIPVRGGEPQEVAALSADIGNAVYPVTLDCQPNGDWAIYSFYTGESFEGNGFSKGVQQLCLSNIQTGGTGDAVPFSKTIDVNNPRFSPDGKQICYIRRDWNNHADEWGLYIKDISPLLNADIPVSVTDAAPSGFTLTGNYPNPFNPSTHISFTLPSSGTAKLSIYDVTGRKVRDLVSPALPAGTHEMVWDGRDDSGAAVSSGTYIARLKMGNFTASHRMTLMK